MRKNDSKAVIRAFSKEHWKARKAQKTALLTQLWQTTGYNRKYLIGLLASPVKRKRKIKRVRFSVYLPVIKPLRTIWVIANYACGKRLKPVIPVYLSALKRHGELSLTPAERKLLLQISPATIDRLLTKSRKQINLKGRSRTKPGSLLKSQIPIRMWTDWDNSQPGFLEIDSVHHCGTSLFGDYLYTLDTTDVATGWNECCAHLGKGEARTLQSLITIENRFPFPILGYDFDCGEEFVNWHLVRYCQRKQITYTRAREAVKNDQAYIEQQNYSIVRRFVGYQRLETTEQLTILNRLYELLSDYQNFFQPIMRLKSKIRDGARVTRRYDQPLTAYQRVIKRKEVSRVVKQKLKTRYLSLNPKRLILEITHLGRKLANS